MADTLQKKKKKVHSNATYQGLVYYLPFGVIKAGLLPFSLANLEPLKFLSVHIDRLISR